MPMSIETDWGLNLSILLGCIAIAVSIYFGISEKVRDYLYDTKTSQIEEKIAMVYGYAINVKRWKEDNISMDFMIKRIECDIRSIGRIRKSIKDEQLENLLAARDSLLSEMRSRYEKETKQIERIFITYKLW